MGRLDNFVRRVLAYCDISFGNVLNNRLLAAWLGPRLVTILGSGAIALLDQTSNVPTVDPLRLPDGIVNGRDFFYCYQP